MTKLTLESKSSSQEYKQHDIHMSGLKNCLWLLMLLNSEARIHTFTSCKFFSAKKNKQGKNWCLVSFHRICGRHAIWDIIVFEKGRTTCRNPCRLAGF